MKNNKRVVQISLDIVVGQEVDGFELANFVANELVRRSFKVVGSGFQEDVTDYYEENYRNLLEE